MMIYRTNNRNALFAKIFIPQSQTLHYMVISFPIKALHITPTLHVVPIIVIKHREISETIKWSILDIPLLALAIPLIPLVPLPPTPQTYLI